MGKILDFFKKKKKTYEFKIPIGKSGDLVKYPLGSLRNVRGKPMLVSKIKKTSKHLIFSCAMTEKSNMH